jgi:hypothetical protein
MLDGLAADSKCTTDVVADLVSPRERCRGGGYCANSEQKRASGCVTAGLVAGSSRTRVRSTSACP